MINKTKKIKDNEVVGNYPYLDLLLDNSPQAFPEYYEDAAILNKEINEPNVFNVAVVAKYGAGKSSVINTYLSLYRNKKTHKEKKETSEKQLAKSENNKYTRISLSTFNKNDYDEVAIERSILQQLLYSRKKSKLPNSKIERTNKTSKGKSFWFAVLLTIFVVVTALMGVEFSLFSRDVDTMGATSLFGAGWVKFFLLGLSSFLLFLIVLWALHYRKLKKIKYKDLEADVAQDDDKHKSKQVTNLINKFIDEVLYFFECIDIDLVIFEDLDRLPTTEIFVKLRELNTIINGSAKRAKKVTFLYAVKDELFKTEEERAKFFEFILPVVPVINPVTTKSEVESRLDKLTEINEKMDLTGKFIKGISTYIPDMRVLKNTFNDYVMMFHKIFEDKNASKFLKPNNLFALCLYKNLFPYDYALLEKNDGLIPLIIDMDRLHNICLKDINSQIEVCKNRIKELQEERVASFEELKGIFISQLYKCKASNSYGGTINPWTINTFKDLEFFRVQHPYVQNGAYNYGYSIALKNGEELLTPRGERFVDVENRIKAKEEGEIENTKKRMIELENQKQLILSWGLADVVKNYGVSFCLAEGLNEKYKEIMKISLSKRDAEFLKFLSSQYVNKVDEEVVETIKKSYKEFATEKLSDKQIELQINYLRFLIAQNYIDEHFIEYTSNYKAEILSPIDIKTVQNIQSGQLNFNAVFENVAEVVRWLDEEDFENLSILSKTILDNIKLIKELSAKENDKKYSNLIKLLSDTEKSDVLSLVQDYLNVADDNKCDDMLWELIPHRPLMCSEILLSEKLRKDRQDLVLIESINNLDNFDLYAQDEIILQYVINHTNYLKIFNSVRDIRKVKKFLSAIKPKFKMLFFDNNENAVQNYIIENDFYEISLENLVVIFNVDVADQYCDFYTKNYETVLSFGKEYVKAYVENNIDEYVSKILLNVEVTCESESSENMLQLLQNVQISIEHKKALLSKIKVTFNDIKEFNTELYEALFDNNRISADWRNILVAYEVKSFDCVKDFIKRNKVILGPVVGVEDINKETPMQLINAILKGFNEREIVDVANTLPAIAPIGGLELSEIDDAVLSKFISLGKSMYNDGDASLLICCPQSLCEYIVSHSKQIEENFDVFFSNALPQNCFAAIVKSDNIEIQLKKKILNKYHNVVEIAGYEQVYADYILNGNVVLNDILWQFAGTSLDADKKYKMLEICNYGGVLTDCAGIKEYLMSISDEFKKIFVDKKQTILKITDRNTNLLNALLFRKIIHYYKKVRNKDEYKVIPVNQC